MTTNIEATCTRGHTHTAPATTYHLAAKRTLSWVCQQCERWAHKPVTPAAALTITAAGAHIAEHDTICECLGCGNEWHAAPAAITIHAATASYWCHHCGRTIRRYIDNDTAAALITGGAPHADDLADVAEHLLGPHGLNDQDLYVAIVGEPQPVDFTPEQRHMLAVASHICDDIADRLDPDEAAEARAAAWSLITELANDELHAGWAVVYLDDGEWQAVWQADNPRHDPTLLGMRRFFWDLATITTHTN